MRTVKDHGVTDKNVMPEVKELFDRARAIHVALHNVAEMVGIDPSNVSRWRKNYNNPSMKNFKLMDAQLSKLEAQAKRKEKRK